MEGRGRSGGSRGSRQRERGQEPPGLPPAPRPLDSEGGEGSSERPGACCSFQWRQPSLDVEVGDPNPDVVRFRSTWTKYIQENKQKWKERAASGGCRWRAAGRRGLWGARDLSLQALELPLAPRGGNGADWTKDHRTDRLADWPGLF